MSRSAARGSRNAETPAGVGEGENAAVGNSDLHAGLQVLAKRFVMEALVSRIRDMIGT